MPNSHPPGDTTHSEATPPNGADTSGEAVASGLARWLVITCCLSQFVHNLYGSVVNIALPAISKDLGAGINSLQWVVSAYVLALASLLTVSGNLADRFGRKRILLLGNVVMIAGAITCALTTDTRVLIVGRFVQGTGSALIAPAGLALLSAAFPHVGQRAMAVVWWTTIGTVTLAAGPILGGLVVRDLGWQAIFWAGVPIGIVALVFAVIFLAESKSEHPDPFDLVGQVLLILLLAGLAFTLIEGVHLGWGSAAIIAGFVVVVGSIAVLIPYERRHPYPLVPVTLFTNRPFTASLLTALLGYLSLAALLFLNTFYLQAERGLQPMTAGFLTIPLAVGATTSAQLSGRFVASGRSRFVLLLSGALITTGALLLWATEHAPAGWTVVPYFVFGLGFGFIADPISVTALSSLPVAKAGLASSLISTSKQVGQMLGLAGAGTLLAIGVGSSNEARAFHDNGWLVWSLLTACGVGIFALNLPRPPVAAPPDD